MPGRWVVLENTGLYYYYWICSIWDCWVYTLCFFFVSLVPFVPNLPPALIVLSEVPQSSVQGHGLRSFSTWACLCSGHGFSTTHQWLPKIHLQPHLSPCLLDLSIWIFHSILYFCSWILYLHHHHHHHLASYHLLSLIMSMVSQRGWALKVQGSELESLPHTGHVNLGNWPTFLTSEMSTVMPTW